MTKVKPVHGAAKDVHRHVLNGSISKKKHQKFKQTPKGKVALINGSKSKTNGDAQKQKNGSFHKSPKNGNRKSNSPKASGSKSPQVNLKVEAEEEDDSDSSIDDINEGISIKEEVSAPEDEVDDDSSEESAGDVSVKDILGKSLADDTDEDDDEFDVDSDAEVSVENKGIKMFKGLKQEPKQEQSSEASDDDEEDDDDESENDDEEEKKPGLAILLGDSIVDESDDEEFEAAEDDSDEDEDASDAEEDSDVEMAQSAQSSIVASSNDEEDDDDDDDEEDEDEDEDDSDDVSSPDITALLGKSIVDESDDEDFEGEEEDSEDEDMSEDDDEDAAAPSPSKKSKSIKAEAADEDEDEDDDDEDEVDEEKTASGINESHDSTELITPEGEKPRRMTAEEKESRNKRTIFVGNVPKETQQSTLKKVFKKFGAIDSLRIRGIVPENPNMPLKVAAIKKKHHPKINTVCCFITYVNEDSVAKALSMNGKKLDGNFLRVDLANPVERGDKKKTVFLGNLPFTVEDNEIWETFKKCGKIESVRIIRDRKTGLGRGFGYVNFETADGAVLAMDLNGTMIKNRELRIKVNTHDAKKQKKETKRNLKRSLSESGGSPKKMKTDDSEAVEIATRNSVNAERRTNKKKRSQGEKQRVKSDSSSPSVKSEGKYQGQKADAKKKPKQDKSAKRKKQMAAKLLAKPKKPTAN